MKMKSKNFNKTNRIQLAYENYISNILVTSYGICRDEFISELCYGEFKNLVIENLDNYDTKWYVKKVLRRVIDNLYRTCFDLKGLALSMPLDLWCSKVRDMLKERGVIKC